jgi:lipoprotein-anchoring transpeptidase ErfK/SrfK
MKSISHQSAFAALCVFCLSILFLFIFLQDGPLLSSVKEDTPRLSVSTTTVTENTDPPLPEQKLFSYIEITDGCGPYHEGTCVNVRSGPGTEYPSIAKLRTGVVLSVKETAIGNDGSEWYKVQFVHTLLYPERVTNDWYVSKEFSTLFTDVGDQELKKGEVGSTTKSILVDRSDGMLYAYDADTLIMKELISVGLELTPTPRGKYIIFRKTPSRYMQGPMPNVSDQYYDLPGVPWNLYFTSGGAVIHGAYWHDHFGKPWSHGCVNLPTQKAKELYKWADIGTPVTVRD